MKTRLQSPGQGGNTLPIVLVATILLGVSLTGLLTLVNQTNQSTMRSQLWNSSIPVVEAGVEDALTHINIHGSTNLQCSGWQKSGNLYYVQRTIGDHSYLAIISGWTSGSTSNQPIIESRAFMSVPNLLVSAGADYFLANAGGNNNPKTYVARGVSVKTARRTPFCGLVAKGSVQMQSTTWPVIDSYDSTSSSYSSNGIYVAGKAKQGGFVGSNSRITDNMQIQGNVKIVGNIGAGASGVIKLVSPASVGDLAFVSNSANDGKIQAGHSTTSLNIPFPDVAVPFTGGYTIPGSGSHGGVVYTYLLSGGNYQISKIELNTSTKKLMVTGESTLYVTDSFLVNNGSVIVAPGAKLNLYVEKAFEAKGAAKINVDGTPNQFAYYGRPQNTSFQVTETASMTGTFYAPQANAQFQHDSVLCGAAMFNSLQTQGNFKFHFDESLYASSDRLFMVTTWDELPPHTARTVPQGVPLYLP